MRSLAPWILLFLMLLSLTQQASSVNAYNSRNLSRAPNVKTVISDDASFR